MTVNAEVRLRFKHCIAASWQANSVDRELSILSVIVTSYLLFQLPPGLTTLDGHLRIATWDCHLGLPPGICTLDCHFGFPIVNATSDCTPLIATLGLLTLISSWDFYFGVATFYT